jgi:hypothetical protein
MTIDKKWLDKYCESTWVLSMTKEQEELILARFGTEPGDGQVWTEEDIYTQILNIVNGRDPILRENVTGDRV